MSSKKPVVNVRSIRAATGRKDEVVELLREIAERPALNGGFMRLSQMQEDQCRDLTTMKTDVGELKVDVGHLKDLVKWGRRAMWAIFAAAGSTIFKLIFEMIGSHISVH